MADGVTVDLVGIERAERILKEYPFKIRRRIAQAATRAGGNVIRDTARKLAPVDTGTLKRQIVTGVKTDRVSGKVTATIKPKRSKAQRKKGKAHSGRYLHLVVGGTKPHIIRDGQVDGQYYSRIEHPGAKPRPFMDQAASLGMRSALTAFASRLDMEIAKQNAKLAATDPNR